MNFKYGRSCFKKPYERKETYRFGSCTLGQRISIWVITVPAPASTGTFEVEIYNNTSAPTENSVISTTQCSTAYKTVGTMQVGIAKNDTLTSEIWWSLKVISSHYSYKSAAGINLLFQKMFPDSKIAANFQCGDTETAYLTKFGIAPHFNLCLFRKLLIPVPLFYCLMIVWIKIKWSRLTS